MKNKFVKRLLSFVLSLAIVFGMVPTATLNAFADSGDKVYISISFDGQYQNNMCYEPVSISDVAQINLDNYGLSDYKYDADGDGSYETTVLHLYVYVHTNLLELDWDEVGFSGDAGSIFFERGIFGFPDCNLNYYVNGEYPLQAEGWGATADICLLKNGDFIDIAGFTSWNFWPDSNSGFKYFADDSNNISHSFTAKQNETFTVNLTKTMQDMTSGSGTLRVPHSSDVYYSQTAFDDNATYVTTDDNGKAYIEFDKAGIWYLWSYGEYGVDMDASSIVNSPAYATVTVEAAQPSVVAVESVTLDKNKAELEVGKTENLTATVNPDNATDKTVVWTSSDESVAKVENGVVTAVAAGTATITATAGEKSDSCTVTVKSKNIAVESVTLDKNKAELEVGKTENLTATVNPGNVTDKTVVWTSSDESVAKVENGVVTAVAVGTATITATADGKSDVCTIIVKPKSAKLKSLILYTGNSATPSKSSAWISNDTAIYTKSILFDENIFEYDITNSSFQDTQNTAVNICAIADEGESVTITYGNVTKDITGKAGEYIKFENMIKGGKNEYTITVSSKEEGVEATTYTIFMYATPTLIKTALVIDSEKPFYAHDGTIGTTDTKAEIIIPESLKKITLKATPKDESYTVKYNGNISETVDISKTDIVNIVVSKDDISKEHTVKLTRVPEKTIKINTVPKDATVKLECNGTKEVVPEADGSYKVIFYQVNPKNPQDKITYTYTVSKDGYIPETGKIGGVAKDDNIVVSGESLTVDVELSKELGKQPEEISDVDWKNFRNSDANMAITSVKTPTDKIALKWNKTLGTGWGSSPSVPIIVDNKIVVMSGKKLCMLDAQSGEIVKEADMVSAPNFGYTPPTYANGMIFCPLSNGTVQAFNATTLESLWVYTDDQLGGQALSPVAYSTVEVEGRTCGYIYTGFWNGESGDANYVCIDVTDYDTDNKTEPKTAVWSHKQKGGFYWAGAVVVGDAVIVGTDDGGAEGTDAGSYLYSFNKKTGEVITELALASDAGDQRSSIAYENGTIYFTTKGGYLYSAKVNSDGTVTGLKGVNYDAQITSTPVVYKGKVYFGIGSGIRTDGSEGSFVVADADTLKEIASVELKGYPQGSALLSTAYEADGYLYFYMTYNDRPGGISMIKVKTDAQSAADIQLTEIYDAAGFSEFCIASIVCDEDGTLYYKNDSGNFFAVAPATYKTVIDLIDKIGTVTLESESVIKAAREAYEELEESEKAKVTNLDVLIAAEKELENFVKADKVDKLISDIGFATLNNGKRIKAAREAYKKLTEYQKTLVKNYERLLELEKEYNKLAKEAVEKVEKLIDKIGDVDIDSADDIADAKLAYNQLPDELKELVDNYDDLKAAEKELKKLREEALALLAEGKLVLSKSELLELVDEFEKIDENTSYDAVLALMRTYVRLGEKQQLALENSDAVKLAQKIVAKHNHTNAFTGVKADGLEWNIRLVVEETDNETALNGIKEKLENNDILTIWDIYLEDVLTGKKYKPEEAVQIKIPTALLGDYTVYDYLKVLHITDDGRIELLNCEIADGYIVFNAAEFSWYGVVGFMNGEEETVGDNLTSDAPLLISPQPEVQQNNSNPVVWIVIAAVGIAALAVLVVLKKRTADEE